MNTSVTFSGDPEQGTAARPDQEKQTQTPDAELIKNIVRDVVRSEMTETLTTWDRQQQGLRRKAEERVAKKVQSQIEALREAGIDLSSEQAKALEKQARSELEDQLEPAEEPAPQKKQADTSSAAFINQAAEAIWDEFGFTVTDEDPEAKLVITNKTPKEFLASVRKAAMAKQERLNVPPEAKVPTMQGGGQTSGTEADYIKEMLANRGQGYAVMNKIKAKYKELGVDVDKVRVTA